MWVCMGTCMYTCALQHLVYLVCMRVLITTNTVLVM